MDPPPPSQYLANGATGERDIRILDVDVVTLTEGDREWLYVCSRPHEHLGLLENPYYVYRALEFLQV